MWTACLLGGRGGCLGAGAAGLRVSRRGTPTFFPQGEYRSRGVVTVTQLGPYQRLVHEPLAEVLHLNTNRNTEAGGHEGRGGGAGQGDASDHQSVQDGGSNRVQRQC